MTWGKKGLEKVYVIHWIWGQRGRGDCSRCPATDLGMRLGDLIPGNRGRGESLQLAYLLSWPEYVLFSVLNLSGMCAQSHKVH